VRGSLHALRSRRVTLTRAFGATSPRTRGEVNRPVASLHTLPHNHVNPDSLLLAKDTPMRIMILNGPNLNMLGIREPHIYGSTTLDAIEQACEEFAKFAGAELSFHQSNHEGELVDLIQSARTKADALIINPAAYSFTSIAMFDAMKIFEGPIFEVHISNIHARDELHRHSKLSAAVKAVIAGLGPYGYVVAMQAALQGAGKLPAVLPPAMRVGPK
jgi:3-dehydroquinate dehydratase II